MEDGEFCLGVWSLRWGRDKCTSLGLGGSEDLQKAVVRVGPTEAGGGMKP